MMIGSPDHAGIASPSIGSSGSLRPRKLRDRQLENPWKKHDNIPLQKDRPCLRPYSTS